MSYLSRAQSFVERGETMRAFYQLVNGLQRNPGDEPALDLLVDLYIREFHSPGVERDLLLVLESVPQGIDIYEMIYASLEKSGDDRRLKSLVQTREREDLLPFYADNPASAQPISTSPTLQFSHQQPDAPRQTSLSFMTPTEHKEQDKESAPHGTPQHADHTPQPFDLGANPRTLETQKIDVEVHRRPTHILDTGDTEYAPSTHDPMAENAIHRDVASSADRISFAFEEEGATTGVFSSIDHYLDEEHRELQNELAQRSKRRLLWIGLAVTAIIMLLIFLYPSNTNSTTDANPTAPEDEAASDRPAIEPPLPNHDTP